MRVVRYDASRALVAHTIEVRLILSPTKVRSCALCRQANLLRSLQKIHQHMSV